MALWLCGSTATQPVARLTSFSSEELHSKHSMHTASGSPQTSLKSTRHPPFVNITSFYSPKMWFCLLFFYLLPAHSCCWSLCILMSLQLDFSLYYTSCFPSHCAIDSQRKTTPQRSATKIGESVYQSKGRAVSIHATIREGDDVNPQTTRELAIVWWWGLFVQFLKRWIKLAELLGVTLLYISYIWMTELQAQHETKKWAQTLFFLAWKVLKNWLFH